MTTRTQNDPQAAFDEERINDPELENLLIQWNGAHNKKTAAAADERTAKQGIDKRLDDYLEPGKTYRCGSFTLKLTETEAREVEFTRKAGRRINIKADKP